jgi:hypothetical protein
MVKQLKPSFNHFDSNNFDLKSFIQKTKVKMIIAKIIKTYQLIVLSFYLQNN